MASPDDSINQEFNEVKIIFLNQNVIRRTDFSRHFLLLLLLKIEKDNKYPVLNLI